jgi:hypothetical protein
MMLIDHYKWAVIRLVTLQKKGTPGRLLFATVTLLSPGRPLPPKMKGVDFCAVGKSDSKVFFRRTALSAQAAIDWYRSLGAGSSYAPIPTQTTDVESFDGVAIAVSSLNDDPIWPHLGLPMGEGFIAQPTGRNNPAPFMGSVPSRVHRRFGSSEGFEALLDDDNALSFIARRLHLNLRQYPEYVGSVALLAPDPIIKQIDNFMIPAGAGRGERIFYRFIPRPDQTLENLRISTFDEHAHLLTSFETHEMPADGVFDIDKGSSLGTYGYVVTHPQHGTLVYQPATGFVRQISINSHIANSQVTKISAPMGNSADSPRMEYLASGSSLLSTSSVIGETTTTPNINVRVGIAAAQREKIASAKHYGQAWFPNGSREQAMRFVQGEIRKAQKRVMIADPYLAGLQLGQFLYAVNGEKVEVILLTTGLAFQANETESKASKLEYFTDRLNHLATTVNVNPKIRVLAQSVLHDRFLVIDDAVWFLGNSLNALGEKASMIVKLPNPEEVIQPLEDMFQTACSFDDYISRQPGASKAIAQ